jgi:hypothetical protein
VIASKWSWILVAGALAVGADNVSAQDTGSRMATVRAGGLMYDRGGDATNLMLGIGVDWALSRHVLAEVDATWSAADGTIFDLSNPNAPRMIETTTHLGTATAGVQAQALLGPVRPYIGMAGGLYVHYDRAAGGDRFPRYTIAFPAGTRVDITDRIALRGELRARFDVEQDGGSGTNLEQTLGLSVRF